MTRVVFLAGAAFGDVAVSLVVAGAVFGQIWVDSQTRNVVMFNTKCRPEGEKVSSANGRVQFCNFMVGSFSDHARSGRAL